MRSLVFVVDEFLLDWVFQPVVQRFGRFEGARFRFAHVIVDLMAGLCVALVIETFLRSLHPWPDDAISILELCIVLLGFSRGRSYIRWYREAEQLRRRFGTPMRNREIHRLSRMNDIRFFLFGLLVLLPLSVALDGLSWVLVILMFPVYFLTLLLCSFFVSCDDARPGSHPARSAALVTSKV